MRDSFYDQLQKYKQNNLNAVRLFLALAVILSHASILSYGKVGEFRGEFLAAFNSGQMTIGQAAVNLFFFLSGILITASFLKNKNLQHFLLNRFLRIYPAYIAAMIFSAVVIWIFCPDFRVNVGRGFSWVFVFLRDCLFLDYRSVSWDGVFQNNPFPGFANASLWTIPWEFKCYLMVAFIGLFGFFKFRLLILLACIFVFSVYTASHFTGWVVVGAKTEWRFLSYYLWGVSAWLWRDRLPYSPLLAVGSVLALFISGYFAPWFEVLFPIFGTYLIFWICYCKPCAALQWTNRTDLSYGVYLFAFPIQQILAMQELFRNPLLQFFVATPLALGCAWLSWTFIEKRFLQMKGWQPDDYDPVLAGHDDNAKLKKS
jgi:peptidoglycan/LPS O-acetylase OafA/YrhL